MESVDPKRLVFGRNFLWTSVTTLLMESVGPEGQTNAFQVQKSSNAEKTKFSIFHVLCPWIFGDTHKGLINSMSWSREKKHTHFQVQMSPKLGKTKFTNFDVL
ncbi:hypothetical protein H5410_039830 [Solanum commersonii]|uniref:Uncharacterized protein n=1 Tax=Solanum commersonii TaxID=4109 RepID=A0A9J5XPM9_SOLCO|nr:hypothetical protein H5410_039830 [Solanum commersonii]